jgi:hypothetical protein
MFGSMVGLAPRGRIDETLYEDTAAQAEAAVRFRRRCAAAAPRALTRPRRVAAQKREAAAEKRRLAAAAKARVAACAR